MDRNTKQKRRIGRDPKSIKRKQAKALAKARALSGADKYDHLEQNVKGFDRIHITKDGKVFNMQYGKELVVKENPNQKSYLYFRAHNQDGIRKNISHHRALALAWLPNPLNKPHINHIDGNKQNNILSNLEWVTPSENSKHAIKTGLLIQKKGKDSPSYGKTNTSNSKPVIGIDTNGKEYEFPSAKEAFRQGYATCSHGVTVAIYRNTKHNKMIWKLKKTKE